MVVLIKSGIEQNSGVDNCSTVALDLTQFYRVNIYVLGMIPFLFIFIKRLFLYS